MVTGSRIARPNLDASAPVTSITVDNLTNTGDVNIGDTLNDLPSLRSTYSQGNSTRFIGTSGLNLLDLRGLGISRTLVLVNGRRHVTASVGDYLVDVNTIPTDLLERTDIVTGGTSAVYGSDAIAGVVNFVLRRDFDGITGRVQAGVSDKGDRGTQFASLTAGKNFADGRGNITFSGSYTNSDPLYYTARDGLTGAYSGRSQFNLTEPVAGEPAAGDGVIDNAFYTGVRNGTISDGGLVNAVCGTANLNDLTRCRASPAPTASRNQRYVFDDNGNLVLSNPVIDFRDITAGGSTNTVGGGGSTLRNTGQLFPQLERYTGNVLAHFDVADFFRPFVEAKYVRVNSFQEGQPSFFPAATYAPAISCSNAFLTAQNLATLRAIGQCATATSTFTLNRFNVDFGGRQTDVKRETYRIVGGFEGTFNTDWKYEFAVNYGKFKENNAFLNNLLLRDINGNPAGIQNAVNAVRNSAGQIVCAINADASTTNDDPRCVPINLFGVNRFDPAALAYSQTTGFSRSRASQFDVTGYVSGDLSQIFDLPGGPIGFSIGGEYRRERANSNYDALTQSGGTFLNAIQPFTPPQLSVKEVFGELRLPLLRDNIPLVHELTIEGAARYSDYNTAADKAFAYNIGGIYSPFEGLRFRGNYSKSVRVPTQSDLFSTQSQNFAQIQDPCDILYINNGPQRAANCAAAGVPANFVNAPARASSTGFASGGNPTLTEETGKSYTIGLVFEPRFLPGFSVTADYYNIRVKNLIAALGAQTILNLCYDSTTGLNNPFCATVNRAADGTFNNPAVISGGVNFAAQETQGLDVEVAYNRKFDNGHSFRLQAVSTYIFELTNRVNPLDPTFGDRQLSELGDPRFSANLNTTYDFGAVQLNYSMRYIGHQRISTYEAQSSFEGRPPTNADVLDPRSYPDVFYHNIRLQVDVTDKMNVFGGVDNIGDRKPPFGLLGTAGGDPFDSVGRYLYAGARFRF